MKPVIFLCLMLWSCTKQTETVKNVVFENGKINTTFINQIQDSEKALLAWYLYAYGNECVEGRDNIKCELLERLQIMDECAVDHIGFLKQWFAKDAMANFKLKNCPNMPVKSAIQNTFDKIVLMTKGDTLSIQYDIKGLNNSQEKSWNISQTDVYLIVESTLVKVKYVKP